MADSASASAHSSPIANICAGSSPSANTSAGSRGSTDTSVGSSPTSPSVNTGAGAGSSPCAANSAGPSPSADDNVCSSQSANNSAGTSIGSSPCADNSAGPNPSAGSSPSAASVNTSAGSSASANTSTGTEPKFCIWWENQQGDYQTLLKEMKRTNVCQDVTIIGNDGGSCRANRLVLAAHSLYFERILQAFERCENCIPPIYKVNVSTESMRLILTYLYNGEVDVPATMMPDFIDAARLLQVKELYPCDNQLGTCCCTSHCS